jgi:hypothetical protein
MEPAKEMLSSPDEVTWNSFIFALRDWVRNSGRFKDPERWLAELKAELAEIPKLKKKIENLRLQVDVSIQSLLLDQGFSADEIFELMRMPTTAIDVVESNGGLQEWKAKR